MTARPVKEERWRGALRELQAAASEYDDISSDLSGKGLGEGAEALAWLRLRRAVDEYEEARAGYCQELVIDQ